MKGLASDQAGFDRDKPSPACFGSRPTVHESLRCGEAKALAAHRKMAPLAPERITEGVVTRNSPFYTYPVSVESDRRTELGRETVPYSSTT